MAEPPITESDIPEAVVEPRKRGPRLSIVWLIPIIAAVIGAWLAYQAFTEKGPLVTVSFTTAEGLEAGKTEVKFRHVVVGKVEAIDFKEDLTGVIVSLRMDRGAEPYLTDKTSFWVVRARVTAGGVTGLGTLLGGAYIGIDPVEGGAPKRDFVGLEIPPLVTTDEPGSRFVVRAKTGGSVQPGSPVYYKRYKVGEVTTSELREDGQAVDIQVFVRAPFDEFVRESTRFWNASGIDVKLSADGVEVRTESLVSVLLGGIAFGLPPDAPESGRAEDGSEFELFGSQQAAFAETYKIKNRWLLSFTESVRGLRVGAPVEIRGIPFGTVVDYGLEFDWERNEVRVPVIVETTPERLEPLGYRKKAGHDVKKESDELIAAGMRARLQSGNLITGQLFIEFDFYPDAPPATIDWDSDPPEIPTIPSAKQQVLANVGKVAESLAKVPFEEIGAEAKKAVESLNATLEEAEVLVADLRGDVAPAATAAIIQARKTLAAAESAMAANSPLREDLELALDEVAKAARSLRILLDYLEQHPEALLRGKAKGGEQ
jgi:paraquat-inducible protein B